MPGLASGEAGPEVASGHVGGCSSVGEVVLIPAINGRRVIGRADMAARGVRSGTVNH